VKGTSSRRRVARATSLAPSGQDAATKSLEWADDFGVFCEFMLRKICSRPHRGVPPIGPAHHRGEISRFMRSCSGLPLSELVRFSEDAEHGLLHGLMTAYPIWVLRGSAVLSSRMIASCVLHDFLRAAREINEDHDRQLRDVFPDLAPPVYWHSKPGPRWSPLVVGDRWELCRFLDWSNWVRPQELRGHPNEALAFFYRRLRPALARLWQGRDDCWMGHGPEGADEIDLQRDTFPNFHRTESICIEMDRPPFTRCGSHGPQFLWGKTRLWTPLRHRDQVCGHAQGRDHLALAEPVPTDRWIYVPRERQQRGASRVVARKVAEAGLPLVPQHVLNSFWTMMTLFEDRLRGLNLIDDRECDGVKKKSPLPMERQSR
jgi:hypothetical protein